MTDEPKAPAELIEEGNRSLENARDGLRMLRDKAIEHATRWGAAAAKAESIDDLGGFGQEMLGDIVVTEAASWKRCAEFMTKVCEVKDTIEYTKALNGASGEEIMLFTFHYKEGSRIGHVGPDAAPIHLSEAMLGQLIEPWIAGADDAALEKAAAEWLGVNAAPMKAMIEKYTSQLFGEKKEGTF